jgi:hypothetical protein
MAYSLSAGVELGAGNTGLSLSASLYDSANNAAAGLTTATLVEVVAGSGSYLWTGTVPDSHRGYIRFDSAGTFKAKVTLNPQESEFTDIKTSTVAALSATAVWGTSVRTLSSFGTLVTDTAAAVWAYVNRTLTQVIAAVSPPPVVEGSVLTIIKGDTMVLNFTGLGVLTGRSKLWFSVKDNVDDADSASIIFIEETAGLQYLNGAIGTAGQGSITVTNATTGAITVTLDEVAAALLSIKRGRFYSIKDLTSGVATTRSRGTADVTWSTVKATS